MREIFFALLFLAGGTWFAGIIGAVGVAFFKKSGVLTNVLIPGFAAGVILTVSFLELLHPSVHLAEEVPLLPAWLIVPGAFAAGFFSAFFLASHIKKTNRCKCKRGVMLLSVLSAHSLPEGLALGVLLGSLGRGYELSELWVFVPVFLAVGLHKFPEGAAVSVAFRRDGLTKFKSFLFGQASGFFAFLSGVVGFVVAVNVSIVLPFAMAFAGGAMIWVAVHELIPRAKVSYFSVVGLFLGIFLMLFVDITLHIHHNESACQCACVITDHDVISNRMRQGAILE
ncbi:MAG: ZIP family metal transporter [Defluviitaleaceae bacterium]|nr:ZIP family metal transporter [Defluviitaleaceae bacterium]